jgi:hypothetical protein
MGRAYSTNGEKMNTHTILVGKAERKRPIGRPRRICVDNIKMNLKELRWGGVNWIDVAQDSDQWRAFVIAVMNLRVP